MSYTSKPKNGFVLGKFMPPHLGHQFLCEFGASYCENLTILVCSLPDEPIPGELRFQWMKQMFPQCNVVWCDKELPQEPKDENDTVFWAIWREVVFHYAPQSKIDVIFASEPYGKRLAKEVGAEFIPCDMGRVFHNCSGTEIRENPLKMWKFIPQVVRPYYTKRVCLFGPESSGKSTLAKRLAEHYETVAVPEYGRTYTEFFGAEVNENGLNNIVKGHMACVQAAKYHANKILIEDTDPIMTAVWSDMLVQKRHEWFDSFNDYADLYILCDIDIPWVDDGTRYFPKQEDRERFFEACLRELRNRKVNFTVVSGSVENRLEQSEEAISRLLKQ